MKKNDELYKFIKKTISKIAEIPIHDIHEDSNFQDDLCIDSLEAVEILHKVEKKYKIKLRNIELDDVQTLGEIYHICKNKIIDFK